MFWKLLPKCGNIDNKIKHIYDEPIISGDGYQQINNGENINMYLPNNIMTREIWETNQNYQCNKIINDEYIFSTNSLDLSCCNYELFGDANYDCRHTAFDAQITSFYLVDSTVTQLFI